MADLRIDRSIITTPQEDYGEIQHGLGLPQEATSLPEWQGFDRMENAGFVESTGYVGLDVKPDIGRALEHLRLDPQYEGTSDLDDKRLLLDSMNTISGKLDGLVENSNSEKLVNFRETFNELLDLYQTAYGHQTANIKG